MDLLSKIESSKNYIKEGNPNIAIKEIINGKIFVIYKESIDYSTHIFNLFTNKRKIIRFWINEGDNKIYIDFHISYNKFSEFLITNVKSFYNITAITFKSQNDIDEDSEAEYIDADYKLEPECMPSEGDIIVENSFNNPEFYKFYMRIVDKFKQQIYDNFKDFDENFETLMGTILQICRKTYDIKNYFNTYKDNPSDLIKLKAFITKITTLRDIYISILRSDTDYELWKDHDIHLYSGMSSLDRIIKDPETNIWTIKEPLNCSIEPTGKFSNPYYLHFITKLEPLFIPILHLCADKSAQIFGAHNTNGYEGEIFLLGSSRFQFIKQHELRPIYYRTNKILEYDNLLKGILGHIILDKVNYFNKENIKIYEDILKHLDDNISIIKDTLNLLITDGTLLFLSNFFEYESEKYIIFETEILKYAHLLSNDASLSENDKNILFGKKYIQLIISLTNNINFVDDSYNFYKQTRPLVYVDIKYIDNNIDQKLSEIMSYTSGGNYMKYLKYKNKYLNLKNH